MYQHGRGRQVQPQQIMYRQGLPGSTSAGVPALPGGAPMTPTWMQLKTYSTKQPGPPYRGTRLNKNTNKWSAFVMFQGREVKISTHDHEEDAALAHDRKVLELHGAKSSVNFQYTGLVEQGTMKVVRLKAANGQEIPLRVERAKGGAEMGPSPIPIQETYNRPSAPPSPSSGRLASGLIGRHSSAGLPGAAMMGSEGMAEWAPRSDRAYTAADHASVANAREHNASLVYEIAFPRPGALGLNLRSYLVQQPAGARHDLPPYGALKVLDTQNIYLKTVVESGDLLIAVNGQTLTGTKFNFEDAIALCSTASLPRVFRFARMEEAASSEIECALAADVCAVFDAVDAPQKRLVTAQLHPSAPPYFYLNPPTRQPRKTSPPSAMTATATASASNTTEALPSIASVASFPPSPAAGAASAAIPSSS